MGGADKGLQTFHGVPLALHALRRLAPQVGPLLLNANRNLAAYEAFGIPVWPDDRAARGEDGENFAGPLAGFLAGLAHCSTPYLLTVPCDTPLFPLDLAARLAQALAQENALLAIASAPDADGQLRSQPVFCLMAVSLHASLSAFVASGGRKIGAWTAQQRAIRVAFNQPGDGALAFFNANTLAELQQLESQQP